jgi:ubiquinone biosynthesis monooxygenase Coq7
MVAVAADSKTNFGDRVIKVDHAGEFGAICIYTGQIFMARLTAPSLVAELLEFREHERRHRSIFAAELQARSHPRCKSYFFCGLGGLTLGLLTGLFGRKSIAATTVAVEAVVLRHLEHQLATLTATDPAAAEAVRQIVEEEQQHHDRSAEHFSTGSFWPRVIRPVVAASTESVIWLGMRL